MIRRARAEDRDAIASLHRRSLATLGFLRGSGENGRHFEDVMADAEVWVADDGVRLLGFAALTRRTLELLYVDPADVGRGVGSALFDRAKVVRPEGFRVWVFQRNEQARRFYERRGCRLVELTDGAGNDRHEPDALYAWLPGGD